MDKNPARDIFLDLDADPLVHNGGLEYLFGVATFDDGINSGDFTFRRPARFPDLHNLAKPRCDFHPGCEMTAAPDFAERRKITPHDRSTGTKRKFQAAAFGNGI
jgi:hypothetical protein